MPGLGLFSRDLMQLIRTLAPLGEVQGWAE
jgi:hypothetical protein